MSERRIIALVIGVAALGLLSACMGPRGELTREKPRLSAVSFADLPGWQHDDLSGFSAAAGKTCARLAPLPENHALKNMGTVGDWRAFCAGITAPNADARSVIETYLTPWRVTIRGFDDGLFTGYYEASLKGSRTRHGPYQTPIRAKPNDHVVANLGDFKPDLAGQRITAQLTGGPGTYALRPYPARAAIEDGGIPVAADNILAWVDDPVDAFFLEIQGSGRIALDDGSVMHVGYAERNGQAYTAVGKELVAQGVMTAQEASMQSIRAWMAAKPDQAIKLRQANASYIFFRDIGPDGPVGAENLALTPLRSLAIDKDHWPYGLPFYIDTVAPSGDPDATRVRRLFMGQDTGGAIKGAVRGDVFWGYGDHAAHQAGLMKSRGFMWVLLPKGVLPEK